MTVALETHKGPTQNAAAMLDLMADLDHAAVRLNFDTGNIAYYNEGLDPADELEKVKHLVRNVHLKDNRGGFEDWYFPAVGDGGAVDFRRVREILDGSASTGPTRSRSRGSAASPSRGSKAGSSGSGGASTTCGKCGYFEWFSARSRTRRVRTAGPTGGRTGRSRGDRRRVEPADPIGGRRRLDVRSDPAARTGDPADEPAGVDPRLRGGSASLIEPSRLARRRPSGPTTSGTWPKSRPGPPRARSRRICRGVLGIRSSPRIDLGHAHRRVVDDHGELIGRDERRAGDEEVAADAGRVEGDRPADEVVPGDIAVRRRGTARRRAGRRAVGVGGRAIGAGAGIGRPLVLGVGGRGGAGDLGAGAGAGIDQVVRLETLQGVAIRIESARTGRKGRRPSRGRASAGRRSPPRRRRGGRGRRRCPRSGGRSGRRPIARRARRRRNVRAWPRCRPPVGEGARRPTTWDAGS